MIARIIELEDTLDGREVRAKVTEAPFGMGPLVKLQTKGRFLWTTRDRMIPYDPKRPDTPVAVLVKRAVRTMLDQCIQHSTQTRDLRNFLSE